MTKIRVLFVCVHNSARSQMAEAYLKNLGGDKFEAESAGIEPGVLNPIVVEAMKEDGIDISGNETKSAMDFFREGRTYLYVITVCEPEAAEKCPIYPGVNKKIAWSFEDPSSFTGTHDEKLAKTRGVRDKIKAAVKDFVENFEHA